MTEVETKRRFSSALRAVSITYNLADVVTVALLAALVTGWMALAGDSFSWLALLACEAAFFTFYLAGSLLAAWTSLAAGVLFDLPLRLLAGYGVVNTALLVLAWVSPLGMAWNFCLVAALLLALFFAAGERKQTQSDPVRLWAICLCAAATTLWCQDSLDPIADQGRLVSFKPWVDGFYHAVHIRIFAESHGAATIEDFRLAGVPARLYHYGVYMMPALIKQVSAVHSYTVFAGLLAPVGVFFTGLAAYAFFGSLWGAWPGLTACAALLLLPDGSQQTRQNPYLSYQWLTQISPSATYGLALLAMAWLFVLAGCRRSSRLQLGAGWLLAAVLALYKLHYAIASAGLLLVLPAFAFQAPLRRTQRALWALGACATYAAALLLAQKVPGVPQIRFDGSGMGEILRLVQSFQVPGSLQDLMAQHTGPEASGASNLLLGLPYVLALTFGLSTPVLLVLAFLLRKQVPLLDRAFPLLLIANFLAMFFGLALDMTSSTPDELSHRPLMIVYFFVTSWVGAALGFMAMKSSKLQRFAPKFILGLAVLLLGVPLTLGPGVQFMPGMPQISPMRIPKELLQVAEYIRTHGDREDLVQDSQFDRVYALSALAERRSFVSHTLTRMPFRMDEVARRSTAVDRLMWMDKAPFLLATAQTFRLRWFVVRRGDRVNWPPEITSKPALEAGQFTLYEF